VNNVQSGRRRGRSTSTGEKGKRDNDEDTVQDMTMVEILEGLRRRDDGEETLERWQSFWPAEGKRNRKLGSDASVEFLTPKYKSRLERLCGWRELGGFWAGQRSLFPCGRPLSARMGG
jgi:hypothetical protein